MPPSTSTEPHAPPPPTGADATQPWIRLARTSRWPRWPRWAVALVIGWLALGYVADSLAKRWGTPGPTCMFKRITTQPCPTCGSGRGSLALLRGDVPAAMKLNPLYFTLLGLGGLLLAMRLAFARKIELSLGPRGRRIAWAIFLTLVAADWAYLIATGV